MKKIGIFAGAFDPIHDGHIEVAKSTVEFLELDNLYFMVEKDLWTPKKPIDVKHRKKMVDIAIDKIATLSQLDPNQDRFVLPETLIDIENCFPGAELYFIFGADVFLRMSYKQWPNLDKLLRHYVVVFERDKLSQSDISDHAKELGIACAILPSMLAHHSSSDVRLIPHAKSIWVPEKVAEYIDKNNLYQ